MVGPPGLTTPTQTSFHLQTPPRAYPTAACTASPPRISSPSATAPPPISTKTPTAPGKTPTELLTALTTTGQWHAQGARHVPSFTLAHCVEMEDILRNRALKDFFFPIVTPYKHERWREMLEEAGVLDEYADIPDGIENGFEIGLEGFSLTSTFSPPNHYKSSEHHNYIVEKYADEIQLNRISPGYPPEILQKLVGHYRTAPMNVVERVPGGKLRATIDHSYPRTNPNVTSINANIDSKRFQCAWGSFSEAWLLVANAPEGTQVRIIFISPSLFFKLKLYIGSCI